MILSQDHATSYEKAVFDAVTYLMSPDRDDDVAVDQHSKVFPFSVFGKIFLDGLVI